MLIKFDKLNEFVAGDGAILREHYNPNTMNIDLNHSLAYAKVLPNRKTKPHSLKTTEIYVIQSGKGIMHIDENAFDVQTSDAVVIPPNAVQYIENNSEQELTFFCIVEPAWKLEDEIII